MKSLHLFAAAARPARTWGPHPLPEFIALLTVPVFALLVILVSLALPARPHHSAPAYASTQAARHAAGRAPAFVRDHS
jgi:hypothetical protein